MGSHVHSVLSLTTFPPQVGHLLYREIRLWIVHSREPRFQSTSVLITLRVARQYRTMGSGAFWLYTSSRTASRLSDYTDHHLHVRSSCGDDRLENTLRCDQYPLHVICFACMCVRYRKLRSHRSLRLDCNGSDFSLVCGFPWSPCGTSQQTTVTNTPRACTSEWLNLHCAQVRELRPADVMPVCYAERSSDECVLSVSFCVHIK